nr:MAG TPA: hypothetical protein [Caudoviricetes sp.]
MLARLLPVVSELPRAKESYAATKLFKQCFHMS